MNWIAAKLKRTALREQPAPRSPCLTKAMPKSTDLSRRVYGRWIVISGAGKDSTGRPNYNCLCSCGTMAVVAGRSLMSGDSRSCGCLRRELQTKHGKRRSSEYKCWTNIKSRCLNEKASAYQHYGARGISICERWKNDFLAFYDDMGPRPSSKHSIERIDNTKGYQPDNCRWALPSEQVRNTRSTVFVRYQGQKMCLADAAASAGLSQSVVYMRRHRGWPEESWLLPLGTKKPA